MPQERRLFTRNQEEADSKVDDSCRLPKGKNVGVVDLSQVAKFVIWDWVGVGQLIVWQCNAGSLQCQSNFLPFRRFCSVTNFFSLSCRNGRRRDKNPEEADCK